MRTLKILAPYRVAAWTIAVVLLTCLGACDRDAQPDLSVVAARAAAPAIAAPTASSRSTFQADEAVALATARDQAARAAREQTLRVQRQLVEQRRATRDAAQHGNGNERCIGSQRMRRVANGWVQAGAC